MPRKVLKQAAPPAGGGPENNADVADGYEVRQTADEATLPADNLDLRRTKLPELFVNLLQLTCPHLKHVLRAVEPECFFPQRPIFLSELSEEKAFYIAELIAGQLKLRQGALLDFRFQRCNQFQLRLCSCPD